MGDLLHFESFNEKLTELCEWLGKHYGVEVDIAAEIELYKGYADLLKDQIVDTVTMTHKYLNDSSKKILVEGANAALLDIDFGTYPYVTSSNTTAGCIMTGLGVPPKAVQCIVGVRIFFIFI